MASWLLALALLERIRRMEQSDDSSSDMDYDTSGSDTDMEDFIVNTDDSSDESFTPSSIAEVAPQPLIFSDEASSSDGGVIPLVPPFSGSMQGSATPASIPEHVQPEDNQIQEVVAVFEPFPREQNILSGNVNMPNDPNPEIEGPMPIEIGPHQEVEFVDLAGASAQPQFVPVDIVAVNDNIGPSRPRQSLNFSYEEDGQMCPICFEPWTNSGEHRLVSLKCGHLFGQQCIEKWIKGSAGKAKCPQCNSIAKKADIRKIFAKSLRVLDTSERDRALESLSKEQELRRKMEIEKNQMFLRYQMSSIECEKLKKELMDHKSTIEQLRSSNRKSGRDQLGLANKIVQRTSVIQLERTIELNKDGGCRVMCVSCYLPLIVTSQPSKLQMFSGFGIKKLSTMDFRPTEFVFLHQKEIKDLVFHPHDSLVLSASLDKTAKITNVYSNSIVQTYNLPMEAWSCSWDKENGNTFFVGLRNGSVLMMDTRKPSTEVHQLFTPIPMSPVVGLECIQRHASAPVSMSGLLALQLSGCSLFESQGAQDFKCHPLPFQGRFTSLSLEPSTGHVLISSRPSTKQKNVNHMLCELTYSNVSPDLMTMEKTCSCNILQTLEGGPTQAQLTRSKLLLNPRNESTALVCAGDEAAQAALLWDVNSGKCVDQLKAESPVLDVSSFRANNDFFISTLTKSSLRVYKWKDD